MKKVQTWMALRFWELANGVVNVNFSSTSVYRNYGVCKIFALFKSEPGIKVQMQSNLQIQIAVQKSKYSAELLMTHSNSRKSAKALAPLGENCGKCTSKTEPEDSINLKSLGTLVRI